MSKTKWLAVVMVVAGMGLTSSATRARAQDNNSNISVDVRGGYSFTVADGKKLWKPGPNLGIGAAYWFNPRMAVRIDGEGEFLKGRTAADIGSNGPIAAFDAPNMQLYHYGAGLEWMALDPANTMWRVDLKVGLGRTHMKSGDYPSGLSNPTPSGTNFSHTYWSGYGGLTIGYQFSPNVAFSLGSEVNYILTRSEDFRVFGQFLPQGGAMFDDLWSFPMQGQFTFRF